MRNTRWVVTILATVTLLVVGGLPAAAQDDGIAVGETPEAPVLETLDGDTVDLGEIIGTRPVLVEFWATWCAVCRALEPQIRAAHERFGDRVEFVVVAVGVAQDPDRVRQHLARHPMPGRVVWDGRGRAARAFEAPGTGFIAILNRAGEVAYTGTGTEQDLVAALERVTNDD